ncbi:sulfite exporter TauE/SafE family protein [Tenacibaculum amylolyticum]|uniref:sulfite exporter TauE/SafE family protein n=1 Tax=Tenacibaculum amylolyticum TaxID=104269 RepID=UPI003895E0A0
MSLSVFLILVIGVFLGFFIQTIIGFAGALVALPILLLTMSLQDAISYLALFYLYSSIILISKEWKNINKTIIIRLIIATVFGVSLGIWVLQYGKPLILKKILGIFILLYVLYTTFMKDKLTANPKLEFVFGLAGGFFSGLFSTGGPLYVMVVRNSVVDMKVFRATMFGVLGLITLTRVPILYVQGILKFTHFYYSVLLIPAFLLSIYFGKKMYSRLNENTLKRIVLSLLFISGVMLTIKS